MSNNTNTQVEEVLKELEDQYKDDLKSLRDAEEEVADSHKWYIKRIEYANQSAKALSDFKRKLEHD